MTRYSGIIERNTVTVPNEMEEEIRLKENPWPRDTFKYLSVSSQYKFQVSSISSSKKFGGKS